MLSINAQISKNRYCWECQEIILPEVIIINIGEKVLHKPCAKILMDKLEKALSVNI